MINISASPNWIERYGENDTEIVERDFDGFNRWSSYLIVASYVSKVANIMRLSRRTTYDASHIKTIENTNQRAQKHVNGLVQWLPIHSFDCAPWYKPRFGQHFRVLFETGWQHCCRKLDTKSRHTFWSHTTYDDTLCVVCLVDRRVLYVGTSTRWAFFFVSFPPEAYTPIPVK